MNCAAGLSSNAFVEFIKHNYYNDNNIIRYTSAVNLFQLFDVRHDDTSSSYMIDNSMPVSARNPSSSIE